MDGLLAPGALIAGLLAVPILVIYMLRTRRPRHVVPSTFLWREATKNVSASRPWDRIKPTVLLILQLLLLAALVIALARPYTTAPGVAGDHLVLVVDASASMLATDVAPDRLGAAKVEANRLIGTISPGTAVSVVAATARPRVVLPATDDASEATAAVDAIEATEAPADFAEAFLLAESLEVPGRPTTIAIVSDGGLGPEEESLVPPGSVFRTVGSSGDNLSIERLETGESAQGFQALVEVRNHGDEDDSVELQLQRNEEQVARASLDLPAGTSVERSFDLGSATGRLVARIDAADALPADDQAAAILARSRPQRIALYTPGNLFLESLLGNVPGAELEVSDEPADGSGFDLAVYDRVRVPRAVLAPSLYVAPARPPRGVRVLGALERPTIDELAPADPLLAQVDLADLALARALDARIPAARTLVGSADSPLVAVWTQGTRRRAWIGFDLHESNLPLLVAFPILGDRLLSWVTGSEPPTATEAGDPIELPPVPGAERVEIASPQGRGGVVAAGETFTETYEPGFYEISYMRGDEVLQERTIALAFPERESVLAPRTIEPRLDQERPGLTSTSRRPAVAIVLALALALLLFEWWWAHGRPRPQRATPAPERRVAA